MRLYFKYLYVRLRSVMEYKSSFFLTAFTQFLLTFTAFLSIDFLMSRFGAVGGFTYEEVMICYAVSYFSFAFAECFFRGFDTFHQMLGNGEFDRILVRPRNTVFQVIATRIEFTKLGRMAGALLVLVYAIGKGEIVWTLGAIGVLALMFVGGVVFFTGLFVAGAALCFFTVERLEFLNIFTDGGKELGRYPLSIYGKEILAIFTFVLPFACAQYYPFLYLSGRSDSLLYALAPLACFLFLIPCYVFWRIGLRHYRSTGS